MEGLEGQRIIGLGKSHGPLAKTDLVKIHEAALELLEKTGLSDASPNVVNLVVTAGGKFEGGTLKLSLSFLADSLGRLEVVLLPVALG